VKLCRLFLLTALVAVTGLAAAERIPPAPERYFNDYAGVVGRNTADQLNRRLEQFERDSSNQLLVAIYPRMESDSSVADYTVRVAQSWKAGQRARNNGAVLFVFMREHQLYLQVGYGLEGAIPDALAKRIIEREIVPRFRAGNIDGGMTAAVDAMIAATQGEYKGTGTTQRQQGRGKISPGIVGGLGFGGVVVFVIVLIILSRVLRGIAGANPTVFAGPRHRSLRRSTPWIIGGSPWGRSSGGSSWGGGGGGGFSGGGGSFGGGGAGGKW